MHSPTPPVSARTVLKLDIFAKAARPEKNFWNNRESKVGFPIRKFTDQSLFAAPHDLSQRTTSFFASQRQGIHRILLTHLIALIINAHPITACIQPIPSARREEVDPMIGEHDLSLLTHGLVRKVLDFSGPC